MATILHMTFSSPFSSKGIFMIDWKFNAVCEDSIDSDHILAKVTALGKQAIIWTHDEE